MDGFDGLLHETLITTGVIALPVLIVAAGIGTIIAVVQAATQVQEQTLTLLPKVLCVGGLCGIFGGFAMRLCITLFMHAVNAIPSLTLR